MEWGQPGALRLWLQLDKNVSYQGMALPSYARGIDSRADSTTVKKLGPSGVAPMGALGRVGHGNGRAEAAALTRTVTQTGPLPYDSCGVSGVVSLSAESRFLLVATLLVGMTN